VTDSDNTLIKPRSKCGALLKDSVAIVSMLVVQEGDLKASAKPDPTIPLPSISPFSFPTNLSKNLQNSASLPNLRFLLSQIFIPLGVNSNYRAAARNVAFQADTNIPRSSRHLYYLLPFSLLCLEDSVYMASHLVVPHIPRQIHTFVCNSYIISCKWSKCSSHAASLVHMACKPPHFPPFPKP
jgi:hypothetical protein